MTTVDKNDVARLLKSIRDKRLRLIDYLQRLEPKGSTLTNVAVIGGGIASLLTATQLAFGRGSENILASTYPMLKLSAWHLLAIGATLSSGIAAIAGAIYKQQEIASRLAKVQICAVKLEGLEASLEFGLTDLKEAHLRYTQCIADVAFVPASSAVRRGTIDGVRAEVESPVAAQVVPRAFRCTGVAHEWNPNFHLWLVVEVNGYLWPKEGEILPDDGGRWTLTIFEDGATDHFSLGLFVADARGHRLIQAWLNSGRSSGRYEQVTAFAGTRRLARVDGLRLSVD